MIMVGCWRCTYPSIHVEDTLKITVGCLVCGVVCCVLCVHVVLCVVLVVVVCVCCCVVVVRVCGVW